MARSTVPCTGVTRRGRQAGGAGADVGRLGTAHRRDAVARGARQRAGLPRADADEHGGGEDHSADADADAEGEQAVAHLPTSVRCP
jgi:hypothetical protein